MLYDAKNLYANATSISTSAASHTALIGDVIDHGPLASGNTTHNLDRCGLWLSIRVTAAAVSTAAGTLAIALQTADNTAMTGAATVFTAIPAAVASVGYTSGKVYNVPLPEGDYKRYTQLHLTGATHIVTAGSITAALVSDPGRYTAFDQDASVFNS
jgi:hypothetical protein